MASSMVNRGRNVTKEQKELLVILMEGNRNLAQDGIVGAAGRIHNKRNWEYIAEQLNSVIGPNKDAEKWRRAWADMKKYVRSQSASMLEYNRTGAWKNTKIKAPMQLSSIDLRIKELMKPKANDECLSSNEESNQLSNISLHHDLPSTSNSTVGIPFRIKQSLQQPEILNFKCPSSNEDSTQMSEISYQQDLPSTSNNAPAGIKLQIKQSLKQAKIRESLSPTGTLTPEPPHSPIRPVRPKRYRSAAFARHKILEESNKIENSKTTALNRIAAAMEEKNQVHARIATAMEERNKILRDFYLHNDNTSTTQRVVQETVFIKEEDAIDII